MKTNRIQYLDSSEVKVNHIRFGDCFITSREHKRCTVLWGKISLSVSLFFFSIYHQGMGLIFSFHFFLVSMFILIPLTQNQQVLTNIPFDCKGRLDGFWRDTRYCDVIQGCVAGIQKISYGCPQVGERFYFDESTQRYNRLNL